MKLLTFVDLHEDRGTLRQLVSRAKQPDVNFVVCAGDFSTFGRGMRTVLEEFNQLGKTLYIIPGNHEEKIDLIDAVKPYAHCIVLHRRAIPIAEYLFLGYGGGGFTMEDAQFRKIAREWYGKYKRQKLVLVTHQPPYGTKIDLLEKQHVGNIDYRKFIERVNPKLVICGHLHETAGVVDSIGKTRIVNPGWEGMVIELK